MCAYDTSVGSDGVRVHTDSQSAVFYSLRVLSNEILIARNCSLDREDCTLVCFGVHLICCYFFCVGSDTVGVEVDKIMVSLDVIRVHTYILTILPDLIWQCWNIGDIGPNSSRVYADTIKVGIDGILVKVDGRSLRGDIAWVGGDDPLVVFGVQ